MKLPISREHWHKRRKDKRGKGVLTPLPSPHRVAPRWCIACGPGQLNTTKPVSKVRSQRLASLSRTIVYYERRCLAFSGSRPQWYTMYRDAIEFRSGTESLAEREPVSIAKKRERERIHIASGSQIGSRGSAWPIFYSPLL